MFRHLANSDSRPPPVVALASMWKSSLLLLAADLHFYETMRRAESETSAEALADLAVQLSSFLASAP